MSVLQGKYKIVGGKRYHEVFKGVYNIFGMHLGVYTYIPGGIHGYIHECIHECIHTCIHAFTSLIKKLYHIFGVC